MECAICYEKYNTNVNIPTLLLPCCHTFCSACKDELVQREFCPNCRQPITNTAINFALRDNISSSESSTALTISTHKQSQDLCDTSNVVAQFLASAPSVNQSLQYHTSFFIDNAWVCCKSPNLSDPGCKRGDGKAKHHTGQLQLSGACALFCCACCPLYAAAFCVMGMVGTDTNDFSYWDCCNQNTKADGCCNGRHPQNE